MAFERPAPRETRDPDRERVALKAGTQFEGTVVSVSGRKPSEYGGEVRYVDVDRTDGKKISFGIGGWKLEDVFEPIGYQAGDGIRLEIVTRQPAKPGGKTYSYPEFEIDRRGARTVPAASAAPVDDNPPF